MGKSKGGGKGKGGSSSSKTQAPKCTCDHPYNCSCGNRPPRPSKGHKWDSESQEWGGKGHKQKGGSGQSGVVAKEATTTTTGKTKIHEWQKMPSKILVEYCKKQKGKRPPKFKDMMQETTTKFKYRCIVPDTKDAEKDMFFVPSQPVANEEQAKEEAALLALLHLTPSLPHERILPEPYRTTWLNAIQAQKRNAKKEADNDNNKLSKSKKQNKSFDEDDNNDIKNKPPTGSSNKNGAAASSSTLISGSSYVSNVDKRKQKEAKRQQRNARIRKHEAIRMANRNHPVFLSARLRKQIQQLIRGDFNISLDDDDDAAADDDDDNVDPATSTSTAVLSDKQAYVEERLHGEGFTKRQARTAYGQSVSGANLSADNSNDDDEDQWELVYEDCLQWLCVHLDEDQLPEGFDPRGQTLEVVRPSLSVSKLDSNTNTPAVSNVAENSKAASNATAAKPIPKEAVEFANKYGIPDSDASWLLAQSSQGKGSWLEDWFWRSLCKKAGLGSQLHGPSLSDFNADGAQEEINIIIEEEKEVLEAMFADDYRADLSQDGKSMTFTIKIPDEHLEIKIVVPNGVYPKRFPDRILVSSLSTNTTNAINQHRLGVTVHVELIKFMSTLTLGEPMLFELYNHLQSLLQSVEEFSPVSLSDEMDNPIKVEEKPKSRIATPATSSAPIDAPPASGKSATIDSSTSKSRLSKRRLQRPRKRDSFWSTLPEKVPAAIPFPKISKSMLITRQGLPAAKARKEFLAALDAADKVSDNGVVSCCGCIIYSQCPRELTIFATCFFA